MTTQHAHNGATAPMPGHERIAALVANTLPLDEIADLQREPKDGHRLQSVIAVEKSRVSFEDRILVPLQEHLYVAERADGARVVKGACGHEFGDYRENWKERALVYSRSPQDGVIFQPNKGADPAWQRLREFYCPGCAELLDVEPVPIGYPFVFNFLPDLDE